MIVLHAAFPIKEEKIDEALELTDNLVEDSNQEQGMIFSVESTEGIGFASHSGEYDRSLEG